jgi:hypothetical protein
MQELESFLSQPLEAMWRRAGLECAAAQDPHSNLAHSFSSGVDLIPVLDCAGTSHHDHKVSSDLHLSYLHDCPFLPESPACELVGLRDADDLFDTLQKLVISVVDNLAADDTQNRSFHASGSVHVEAVADQSINDLLYLLLCGSTLHNDYHRKYTSCGLTIDDYKNSQP